MLGGRWCRSWRGTRSISRSSSGRSTGCWRPKWLLGCAPGARGVRRQVLGDRARVPVPDRNGGVAGSVRGSVRLASAGGARDVPDAGGGALAARRARLRVVLPAAAVGRDGPAARAVVDRSGRATGSRSRRARTRSCIRWCGRSSGRSSPWGTAGSNPCRSRRSSRREIARGRRRWRRPTASRSSVSSTAGQGPVADLTHDGSRHGPSVHGRAPAEIARGGARAAPPRTRRSCRSPAGPT